MSKSVQKHQIANVQADQPGWRTALPLFGFVLLAMLFVYRETATAMVSIWWRSGTFTHGFLVAPLSLWLIWRLRSQLAVMAPKPDYRMLSLMALAGFAWLLGDLAAVGVVSQFALVTLIVLAVPAILGLTITQRMLFPLAFLYFSVPFGEFAMPQLMEWTANITVSMLRLSGIPVYREGLHFVIPSGNWSVVEACSGVRYIMASLTVGTLFAYLSYRSLSRRLIFVAVAIVVPLLANWLRAYMIVMLGHLSGNKLATGVDHLIYGWLFFGLVIMVMFWIGSRWREDEAPAEPVSGTVPIVANSVASLLLTSLATIVLALSAPVVALQIERHLPPPIDRIEPLVPVSGWSAVPQALTEWTPHFENSSAAVNSSFVAEVQKVGVYIAYYRNQDKDRKMVSSSNVLVRSDDVRWAKVAGGARELAAGPGGLTVRTAELRGVGSERLVVWQWYWVNGHWTASDYKAKVYAALARLSGQGDDSAVLVAYADKGQSGEAALEAFVPAALPVIESALKRTREKR